jgi:hypothetical protein
VMRTGAVIPAAPGEIGTAVRVWTIPAARMKGERAEEEPKDFRVSLSAAALAIAEEMRHNGAEFLFQGGKRGKPLSNMAMLKLLHRMGRGDLTTHGFRSCFKDWGTNVPISSARLSKWRWRIRSIARPRQPIGAANYSKSAGN